jgi:hypothetical protein
MNAHNAAIATTINTMRIPVAILRRRQARADKMGMIRVLAALLFFISTVDAQAQSGWDYLDDSPERLIGLLDLDDIVRGGCGEPVERTTAPVFGAPSQTSSAVGTIHWRQGGDTFCGLMFDRIGGTPETVPTLESGYEIPAAIVYERRGQWFRIRLAKGSAWIRRTDAADFLAYPDMLLDKLAHTMQSWDGTLRATPGLSSTIVKLSEGWKELLDRQLSIKYLGSRRVGSDLWIHIRLLAESECDQKHEGVTSISGWIPAYHVNRSPSVWFSSRGC